MKIIYEFFNCIDCPYCIEGREYGLDGRGGHIAYMCEKGVFGKRDGGYIEGRDIFEVRKAIDKKCPLRKEYKDLN